MTRNLFGNGIVYYIGTQLQKDGKAYILEKACRDAEVQELVKDGHGLEIVCRRGEEKKLYFVMNFNKEDRSMPEKFWGSRDMLTHKEITRDTVLKQYDVYILTEPLD